MKDLQSTLKTLVVMVVVLSFVVSAMSELSFAEFSDNLLFSDDFENYALGSFPSQWALVFNGMGNQYQQVVSDAASSSNKCFQLQGERNWAADAVRYFQSSADKIGFEVSVRVIANTGSSSDDVKVGLWKQIDWGSALWTDGVAFTDNGTIVARDFVAAEGTGTVLQTYVPGQWYHIRFILDRPNRVFSVWVDGVLKAEGIAGSDRPYVFDGLAVSGRYTEILVNYDDVKIFEASSTNVSALQKPILTTSCRSSTSYLGFTVQIKGDLTINETAISDAPIFLSYSVTGGASWQDLTLVHTGSDGEYSALWLLSVTGDYMLKTVFQGNDNYLGTSNVFNFSMLPCTEESVFSVTSNSALSALFFSSASKEISFSVSGDSGTTGYADVNIPISLVSDISDLKVYLDNNQIEYTSQLQGDSWLLHFTYHHSTHSVRIGLGSSSTLLPKQTVGLDWVEIAILVFMGIIVAVLILVIVSLRKKNKK